MGRTRANTYLPTDDYTEYTLIPDVIVGEQGYVRTGLRDGKGRMILRRTSRPVGFLADHSEARVHYAVDIEEGDDLPAVENAPPED